jgi:hypothetical protein
VPEAVKAEPRRSLGIISRPRLAIVGLSWIPFSYAYLGLCRRLAPAYLPPFLSHSLVSPCRVLPPAPAHRDPHVYARDFISDLACTYCAPSAQRHSGKWRCRPFGRAQQSFNNITVISPAIGCPTAKTSCTRITRLRFFMTDALSTWH